MEGGRKQKGHKAGQPAYVLPKAEVIVLVQDLVQIHSAPETKGKDTSSD